MESAQIKKNQILITDVSSFLGAELARSFLSQNCIVFGVGKPDMAKDLLHKRDFTLLELDLTQPLPSYLPAFDKIFHLITVYPTFAKSPSKGFSSATSFLPAISNIIFQANQSNSQLALIAPITNDSDFYDYLTQDIAKKNIEIFLLGDLYGPNMPITLGQNTLEKLIGQAIKSDRVILDSEGLDMIYPAYITDIVFAINKLIFSERLNKNIHFLISEGPKTALSVAYEIQNAARIILTKELGLFFSGPETLASHQPEVIFKPHDLGFTPKINLSEGLKKTFEYFLNLEPQAKNSQPKAQVRPIPQVHNSSNLPTNEKNLKSKIKNSLSSTKSLSSKIPKVKQNLRFKNLLLIVIFILLISTAKSIFDIYWGATRLVSAQTALIAGDLEKAKKLSQNSRTSFQSAKSTASILIYPLSLIKPNQAQQFLRVIDAFATIADSSVHFTEGSQVFVRDISKILDSKSKIEGVDLETPSANFKSAYTQASYAKAALTNSQIPILKSQISKAVEASEKLTVASSVAFEAVNLIDDIVGSGSPKNYLVLLQNNTELRPGGGFIGNFAEIAFADGKLNSISVEDIYNIDGQLKEKIEPPAEIKQKLGIDRLFLRDSNWSPDSQLNIKTAKDFFKKETGKDVDGVIFIDLTLIQNILANIGPINLSDYDNEEINAQNLFDKGEYHAEIGFFPGSTAKRDFFGSLQRALINKIFASPSASWPALFETMRQALQEKHIIISIDNPVVSAFIATHNWNNQFPPPFFNPTDDSVETRDFLSLSEANLGANKVNRFLDRKVSYEMTIGKDADLVAKLTIIYNNKSQAETWPAGKYVNFLRVYVPFAAGLLDHKNGEIQNLEGITTTYQANLTVFSTFVEVPVKSQKEVSFTYHIPKNIKLETLPFYHLYVQKQPGTEKDPFEFRFNLPGYLVTKSVNQDQNQSGLQNLLIETDLATDRQFEIEVAKK